MCQSEESNFKGSHVFKFVMGFFKKKNFMTKYFYLSLNNRTSLMCIYSSKNGFRFFFPFRESYCLVPNKSIDNGHCIKNYVLKVLLSERQTLELEHQHFDDTRRNCVGLCKLAAHL